MTSRRVLALLAPAWLGCASIAGADDWPGAGGAQSAQSSVSASGPGSGGAGPGGSGSAANATGGEGSGGEVDPTGGSGPACFTPANLVAHWRADDISAAVDGALVEVWEDLVGEHDLTSAGSQVPTFAPGAIGKHAAVRFDGVNDKLHGSLPALLDDTKITFFIVARSDDNTDTRVLFHGGDLPNVASGMKFEFCDCTLGVGIDFDTWPGGTQVGHDLLHLPGAQTTSKALWTVRRGGNQLEVYRDGGSLGQKTTTLVLDTVSDEFHLGGARGNVDFWNGVIAEVGVYDASITGPEREDIELCLRNRYGLPLPSQSGRSAAQLRLIGRESRRNTQQN